MKTKQMVILLAVLAALAGAWWLQRERPEDWGGDGRKTILPEDFNSDPLKAVDIRKPGGSVTLRRGDRGWTVAERYGYPADYAKLKSLFMKLAETRVAQTLPADAKETPAYGLSDSGGATTLTMEGVDGRALRKLVFGKPYEKAGDAPANPFGFSAGPQGRYMLLDDGRAVLVSEGFPAVDGSVTDWLDREFFSIGTIQYARLKEGDETLWELGFQAGNDLNVENGQIKGGGELTVQGEIPDGKEIDATQTGAFGRAFSWLRFKDIADPEAPIEGAIRELMMIDGEDLWYTLRVFSLPEQAVGLRIAVKWTGTETRNADADESPEDKERLDREYAKTVAEKREKARTLNDRLSPWTYVMDASFREKAAPDRAHFFKDKPAVELPPPAPSTPFAEPLIEPPAGTEDNEVE